jgi:hypothetical protein
MDEALRFIFIKSEIRNRSILSAIRNPKSLAQIDNPR